MDSRIALSHLHSSLKSFYTLMGRAAPASHVLEYEGVVASLVPDAPERSIFNSVVYDRLEHLQAAYPELARRYIHAGVRAWTVWLMPGEDAAAKFLEQQGHKFDGAPIAMALDLQKFSPIATDKLDWALTKNLGTVATINEEAYDMRGSSFRAALRRIDDPDARFYIARMSGEPMSCIMMLDRDQNTGIYCVATLPGARRLGLNSQLISIALTEARARGCTSATIQATPMGHAMFNALGFRDLGNMAMWELRRA